MKTLVLALVLTLAATQNILPSYIFNHDQSGSIKPQAAKDQYTSESLVDLLKHNFQVLEKSDSVQDLIEEFGKGNLMNPVEMSYLFVVEGDENNDLHANNARVEIEEQAEKLIDGIFNFGSKKSLTQLVKQHFPVEKRQPFYYYKSQGVKSESPYEKTFGIELKRDASNNNLYFFDNQSQKQIGKQFELSACIAKNFPQYTLLKEKIIKAGSELKLDISENNAKDVENLLKDVCAATSLSQMFKKSAQPNFITFVMNYKNLAKNELVQDLLKNMYKKVSQNFAKTIGNEKTFGQVVYTNDMENVESQMVVKSRILAETGAPEVEDEHEVLTLGQQGKDYSSRQFRFWFILFFALAILGVGYALFTMEIQRDTLLYAKFIAGDSH